MHVYLFIYLFIYLLFFSSIVASQRPLWAAGFMCNGSESNLAQCTLSNPIGYTPNCNHINDVGIYCGMLIIFTPQFLLHFLMYIDVLMLCRKFELIPSSNF